MVKKVTILHLTPKKDKSMKLIEFTPAAEGQAAEQDTLEGVYAKFAQYVAPKTNQLRSHTSLACGFILV